MLLGQVVMYVNSAANAKLSTQLFVQIMRHKFNYCCHNNQKEDRILASVS
jgi:hypothetical protein